MGSASLKLFVPLLSAALAMALFVAGAGRTVAARQADVTADAFFDDSVVHDIFLDINSRDWQQLRERFLENIYFSCEIRWRGQRVRNVGIRSKGKSGRCWSSRASAARSSGAKSRARGSPCTRHADARSRGEGAIHRVAIGAGFAEGGPLLL